VTPDWDSLQAGNIDVTAHEGLGWSRAELDRFVVSTTDGGNQWQPVGFQVSLDGDLVSCRQLSGLKIGDSGSEIMSWTDPEGLSLGCETIFDSPLTDGPIVGAVGPTWAKIWVRTDATRHVRLFVAPDQATLAKASPVHHAWPKAVDDFTQTASIEGLSPDTDYVYRVDVDDHIGTVHDFHTAPQDGQAGLSRLAFGSCTYSDDEPVFGPIAAWKPDLFLFLGDAHYGNTDQLSDLRQY